MKKLAYTLMFLAGLLVVSCGEKNEDVVIKHDTTPDQAIDGKRYAGTWVKILDPDTTVTTGSITFAKLDEEYYKQLDSAGMVMNVDTLTNDTTYSYPSYTRGYAAMITLATDSLFEFSANTTVCNLAYANNGFIFSCGSLSGLGTGFKGRITDEGAADMKFNMTVKVGRKAYEYAFTFVGEETPANE